MCAAPLGLSACVCQQLRSEDAEHLACYFLGRIATRATGSFNISTFKGLVEGISHKCCRTIHRKDGYGYQSDIKEKRKEPEHTLEEKKYLEKRQTVAKIVKDKDKKIQKWEAEDEHHVRNGIPSFQTQE